MDIYSLFDEESKTAFETINLALKDAEFFFAGGCVRDILLGQTPKDFDIEVYGISQNDFEKAMSSIGANGVGKSFFVYKYKNFDISLPRSETKTGVGHTGFEAVVVQDKRTACYRRDFTINAMLLGAKDGELLDFFGGVADLHSKILRAVSVDSFQEDSLRVLRAMQFCARFGFKMEPKSVELCAGIALYDISKARIFTEFEKLFAAKYQIYGLYYFFKLGVAQKLFGIHADFGKFLKMARELKKTSYFFEKPRQETFLYQLFSTFKINKNSFLDKIAAPNAYYKIFALQKRAPKNISDRFLVALSLKMPISLWLGAYKSGVKANAKRLGVWHEGYKPDITHQKMIATGFKNSEISKNYTLGLSKEIREKFRG